nr:unnamed protein product [Callosobruchus analis]
MQAYEDLKKELRIRAGHYMKRWGEEILEAKELLKKELSHLQSLHSKMQAPEGSDISVPITEKDVEDWLKRMRTTLATLDDFRKMIKRYKIMDESEIQEFESEIYTPSVDELDIKVKKDLEKLQENEAKLNILIDKLRQGPSEKKLNKMVQEVYRILDGIKNAYGIHCNTEIQVVQKYRTMVECEIEVLQAEITRLLTVYPPDEDRDPKKQRGRGSQTEATKLDPDEALLWEAISLYKNVCKNEILTITDKWLEDQIAKIKHRLSVKLAFHKPRYFKVEYSIYQKRKKELDEHNESLECHKKATFSSAIRVACSTLNPTLEKFKSALAEELGHILKDADEFWDELRVSGLFREGGNYSTEEVSVLQKSLKKLEASARKQLDGLISNAKNGIKPYNAQLEKRHAEEFEHNEHVEKLINRTQQQIKEVMYNLKMKQREINISLKKLVNEFEVNVGKHEYIDTVNEKMAAIFDEFLSFTDIITHPQPVDFYHKHHRFYRERSVMHHTLDEFMAEVLNKYKGFLVQCEVCWIDSCKEYLDTLQKFRNYRQNYLKTFESVFYKNCEEMFQKTVDEVTHDLKEEKKNVERGNKEMFDKLKALYGHPKNESLLKELEEQYKILFVEYDAKYSRISDLYKEKLFESMENVKQRFEETVFKIEAVSGDDKLSDMIDNLLESYNLKISTVQGFSTTIMNYLTKFDSVVASKTDVAPSMVTSESTIVETPENVLRNMEANEELQLEKITQYVDSDLLEYIRNYDKIWSNEIACIKKLFTVKYDRRNLF